MKSIKSFMAATSVALILFSCEKNIQDPAKDEVAALKTSSINLQSKKGTAGYVYTLSNQTAGNKVLVYSRTSEGTLSYVTAYPTGGTGTGTGLGNQGAIALSGNSDGHRSDGDHNDGDHDNDLLLAVNPGSNSVSSFKVSGNGLQWVSTVSSGGTTPVSVTVNNDLVYVLNSGGSGNISGFRLHADGSLHPIANSIRPLSSASAGVAQVSFVADGNAVVITEKATNKIITYTINSQGIPAMMHSLTSAHPTPFGFAVGHNGNIFVSEAAGGAPGVSALSSYHINDNGTIALVDGPVGANQTAACWVVLTNNGKYAYTTNTGSNNLSTFKVNSLGSISVLNPISATTENGPIDAALSNNSKFLYVLNSGSHSIGVYEVANNGSLSSVQTVPGLPVGATGLASR